MFFLQHFYTRAQREEEMNELNFPITNSIHNEVLSLPISPVMTNTEVAIVIEAINSFKC